METLYRICPNVASFLDAGASPAFEPVKAFTGGAAMTALCLMDALCNFEHTAGHRRGLREAGDDAGEPNPSADLGDLIGDLRGDQGSFQTRQDVLDMVSAVDRAWDRVNADDACDGHICFDFEFCPEAIRLRFERGLTGGPLEQALVDAGRDMIDEAEARWVAQRAKQDADKARTDALAAVAQAQVALQTATARLQALGGAA